MTNYYYCPVCRGVRERDEQLTEVNERLCLDCVSATFREELEPEDELTCLLIFRKPDR